MPTRKSNGKSDMPSTIVKSDKHAQDLWKKVHASAVKTYGEGASAHRVAYAALKNEYKKQGDKWVRKAHKGPSDPQAARGPTTRPSSTAKHRAPTARGKVAHSAKEARAKAKQARREYSRSYHERKRT